MQLLSGFLQINILALCVTQQAVQMDWTELEGSLPFPSSPVPQLPWQCGMGGCAVLPASDDIHLPDGATEQDWVLENDGEPGAECVQRQFADVDPINHYPPCAKQHTEYVRELHKARDPQVAGGKV